MADLLPFLTTGLFSASFCLALFALIIVVLYLYFRRRQVPVRDPRMDHAHMMIVLQTMRDMLEQQKDLARKLNRSIDQRVAMIREQVERSVKEMDRVRGSVKELAESLQNAQNQIDRLQGRVKTLSESASRRPDAAPFHPGSEASPEPPPPKRDSNVRTAHAAASPESAKFAPARRESPSGTEPSPREAPEDVFDPADGIAASVSKPALHVLNASGNQSVASDLLDNWVGLDFGGEVPDTLGVEVPETVPEQPEDPEAARQAFRALLDLDVPKPEKAGAAQAHDVGRGPSATGGNGRRAAPLHTRVYEYSDAGMTVSQIAKELGIGKGEIRLILSLRERKGS